MWECGLKPTPENIKSSPYYVTPYVGVWIETERQPRSTSYQRSLLMWECGLKQVIFTRILDGLTSLLMWECGLKL